MTLVLGVDPGHKGAFAVYNSSTQRLVDVRDMPTWEHVVGKKKRLRVDALELLAYFEHYQLLGVQVMVMESVGGRPAQSASAAYVFGYGVGLIYSAGLYSRIAIETVPAATWKKDMNVPGKGKADDSAILQRAVELFPEDRDFFYTKRGGKRVDRAEAAMLAKYKAERITAIEDVQTTYREAETGA